MKKLSENKAMKSNKRPHDFKCFKLKLNEDSVSPHTIYVKEHSVREHTPDKPSGRTLFILNIPPYADEQGIINAFKDAGVVHSVQFSVKPSAGEVKTVDKFMSVPNLPSFRIAYVVFKKVADLDKALQLESLRPMNSESHQIKCGMKKWIDEYNDAVVHPKVLKEKIEQFMKKHDEELKKAVEHEKKLEEEDEDGWVTVTKRGKVQSFARSDKVESKIMTKEEKNRKRKELQNFYTFQIRESKMKHLVSLRQKFEEDKKKIALIKQSRRFKPF